MIRRSRWSKMLACGCTDCDRSPLSICRRGLTRCRPSGPTSSRASRPMSSVLRKEEIGFPMKSFSWDTACRRRLARHYLLEPVPKARLVDAVRTVGGIQAQILSAAELAIGVRVAEVTRQDVQMELWERHSLVKTYGPRGTLHLLPADELPLWMAALQASAMLREAHWYAVAGLEPAQAGTLLDAIGEALDSCCLTRQELADEVARRVGEWARERLLSAWGEFLAPAAFAGRLCFGPSKGSQVTFVRADQWIGWSLAGA